MVATFALVVYLIIEMFDSNNLIYASVSALIARLICHPLDTLKTQIQGGTASKGLIHGFNSIKKQGLRSFYKGLPVPMIF